VRTSLVAAVVGAGLLGSALSGSAAPMTPSAVPAHAAPVSAPAATAPALDGASGPGTHVVAVGDIGYPGGPHDQTAALVEELAPSRLLLAGDIAYQNGSAGDFADNFDPDWGRFRSIWLAVPGNHEYRTGKAAGYRAYFADAGGLWWSRKVGSWRVIGLDSERVGSSKQKRWLKRTLKKYNGTPTLVMWHRPRYSRGEHSDQRDTAGLYRLVKRDKDVKLLLWGHDHDYERMTIPVSRRSTPLPAFVVGTGGATLRCDTTNDGRTWSQAFDCGSHGVLDLRLGKRSFGWAFVDTEGSVTDQGTYAW
jgi:hypothetical protein